MKYLLFALYVGILLWIIPRLRFFRESRLSARELSLLFLIKVAASVAYGWVSILYLRRGILMDTWFLHYESLNETRLLTDHPGQFFTTIFTTNYPHGYSGFLSSRESWWNDVHSTLFIKLLACLNPLTRNSYMAQTPFFAFFALAASVALYRVFAVVYPGRKTALLIGTFFIPSYLFWTAGIYRDAPVALALGMVLLAFHRSLLRGFRARYVVTLLLGLFTILLFRNVMVVLLVPALAAWLLAHRLGNAARTYLIIYGVYAVLFFGLRYLFPALDLPLIAVKKQEDFISLIGESAIQVPRLRPTVSSFLVNTPHALSTVLLRPFPSDCYNNFIWMASVETYLLLGLFGWWLFAHRPLGRLTPLTGFCILFSLTVLLVIGLTVNFLGAMVRYRGLVLPLLVTPLLATLRLPGRKD